MVDSSGTGQKGENKMGSAAQTRLGMVWLSAAVLFFLHLWSAYCWSSGSSSSDFSPTASMHHLWTYWPLATAAATAAAATTTTTPKVDTTWHAPAKWPVNNLTSALHGPGTYGFIFNSSATPPGTAYNWCNMPHVAPATYPRITDRSLSLRYVELIHRHHKRTPYAANTFPHETTGWDCSDAALFYYGAPPDQAPAPVFWEVAAGALNPFKPSGFTPSSCQFPQITRGGLDDSAAHGRDLWAVYHDLLHLIPAPAAEHVEYRVTNNVITSQVAGMVVGAQLGASAVGVHVQPAGVDSLEPQYACPAADAAFAAYGVGSASPAWRAHLDASAGLLAALDRVSGVDPRSDAWHRSYDHYFDNLSARLCHAKALPCNATVGECVTPDMADAVFRMGEYEYSFLYRDAPGSLAASTASFGVWVAELAAHLRAARAGVRGPVYRHNVAHDGSLARLLGILQIERMVWPGMGAEVVFELYERRARNEWFVRILWGGQVLASSSPVLGRAALVPLDRLLAYIDGLVGADACAVPGLCAAT